MISMKRQWLTLFTIGVVAFSVLTIGTTGAFATQQGPTATATPGQTTPTPTTPTPTTPTPTTPTQAQTANVTFNNQTSNGSAVGVNSTILPEGGFVAIYTVNETTGENVTALQSINNSTLGDLVGNSTFLRAGSHENVTVLLNSTLVENGTLFENQTLIAVAHRDTNGNQQFEATTDESYTDAGRVVADSAFVNVTTAQAAMTAQAVATATPTPTATVTATPTPSG